ncbi:septum formation inhibitor Maf [Endozoicomonas montiporae]|uniref:7-methyl-GTP pyrophosphatase n=2 Tax=Endozoicomonas montiporae TaxID=1027273 RepID=A0A081NA26_9GAMM|nr:Maf family protein [Endozoicomonas montiporae]AMO57020.1 Maf-like protein [Endozoicomonas montiporae CL-33]KEQ15299.1 septum formation inhibitor Maf [Endozoicomonas montiporae]
MKLLLASGSPYRKQLLERLELSFECRAPDIDETPQRDETAEKLALRLSAAKAQALAAAYPDHLIIASDQAAQLGSTILGKPGTPARAIEQLTACNNKTVTFYTGLCLLNTTTGKQQIDCVPFTVHFRNLAREQIANYIKKEEPLDCAGSFKCEGLGITLFTRMEGDDPNSLTGLPLIRLTDMLLNEGISII